EENGVRPHSAARGGGGGQDPSSACFSSPRLWLWVIGSLSCEELRVARVVRGVRGNPTAMTQNDLNNYRRTCEVGVAPVAAAEHVVFPIRFQLRSHRVRSLLLCRWSNSRKSILKSDF